MPNGELAGIGPGAALRNGSEFAATSLPDDILVLAESHITQSGKTVLGHWDPKTGGYIAKAKEIGASFIDLGVGWEVLSPAQRTTANRYFLATFFLESAGSSVQHPRFH